MLPVTVPLPPLPPLPPPLFVLPPAPFKAIEEIYMDLEVAVGVRVTLTFPAKVVLAVKVTVVVPSPFFTVTVDCPPEARAVFPTFTLIFIPVSELVVTTTETWLIAVKL